MDISSCGNVTGDSQGWGSQDLRRLKDRAIRVKTKGAKTL